MKKELDKQKTAQLLKEHLYWDNPDCCQDGFWIDKYTLVKSDSLHIVEVKREALTGENHTAPFPMVVLDVVIEMAVDKDCKILSVKTWPKMGIWLDALAKIIRNQQ